LSYITGLGNLAIERFPEFEGLLERRPELVAEVSIMMRGVVAQSTAQQYATAKVKLCNFVKRK
jgi:transcription termination factor Rho